MLCAVCDCKNNSKKHNGNIRYFKFPTDPELWQRWKDFCGPKFDLTPEKTFYVCSDHFLPGDFERNLKFEMGFMKRNNAPLLPTAVPTVNIYYTKPVAKKFRKIVADPLEDNEEEVIVKEEIEFDPTFVDFVEVQNEPEIPLVHENEEQELFKALKKEIVKLKNENSELKKCAKRHEKAYNRLDKALKKSEFERTSLEDSLRRMFSKGQITKMKVGQECRINWDEEVITKATELYAISKRAYAYLLENNFPFPSIRAVQKWISGAKIAEANAAEQIEDPTDDLPVIISYIIEEQPDTEI